MKPVDGPEARVDEADSSPANPPSARRDETGDALSESANLGLLAGRSIFGGLLMGLANLVPGISGGTMLLAAGIYPAFIDSLAGVTKFRFSFRSLMVLGLVAISAGIGILLLAGTLKSLVVEQRWIMYSLFIGLTLGGIPVVWRLTRKHGAALWIPATIAFLLMAVLAWMQANQISGAGNSSFLILMFAGLAGASAMILPGLSGGYLLLLIGQYVPILSAVDQFKDALKARDLAAALTPALETLLPVGLGVVAGIVIVGNLLKWLLQRFHTQTMGLLLGLLLGSVMGLYPFQQGVEPQPGDWIKGVVMTAETIPGIDQEDWPTQLFQPTANQIAGSLALIVAGFAITVGVSLIGSDDE